MQSLIAVSAVLVSTAFATGSVFASESQNETVTLNIMNSSNPDNVFAINWPPVQHVNPFSDENVRYEIWHNEALLDTVTSTRYTIKVSELSERVGCISIRAVLGNTYSSHSAPACFFIAEN
jgi:hypothetical protein